MWVHITTPAKRAEYKAERGVAVNLPKDEAERLIASGQAVPTKGEAEAAAKDTTKAEKAVKPKAEKR